MQTVEQTKQISQGLALTPIVEVLDQATPQNSLPKPVTTGNPSSAKASLDEMFPEQQHAEKRVKQARAIFGDLAKEFTPEELQNIVSEIQFLVETWLDDYERRVFDGLTLRELLHERGSQ